MLIRIENTKVTIGIYLNKGSFQISGTLDDSNTAMLYTLEATHPPWS
jgi:hypothetical protein